jgi:LDH2 family malate/lactate/ureidoglycolate dehydrogenase
MAQHKGYAIAMMMDVLSGVLTGSAFGSDVHGPYQSAKRSGCGHMMIALNIAAFQPLAEFNARMETLIEEIKSVPLARGHDEIFYPGELEARSDERNRREGLHLPDDTLDDLRALARETGLESRAPFLAG